MMRVRVDVWQWSACGRSFLGTLWPAEAQLPRSLPDHRMRSGRRRKEAFGTNNFLKNGRPRFENGRPAMASVTSGRLAFTQYLLSWIGNEKRAFQKPYSWQGSSARLTTAFVGFTGKILKHQTFSVKIQTLLVAVSGPLAFDCLCLCW